MSKTLQEIKDEYAIELGYRNFEDVTGERSVFVVESIMDEVAKRYALEVAKETQRRCAENATTLTTTDFYPGAYDSRPITKITVDKESILSETNIPELI